MYYENTEQNAYFNFQNCFFLVLGVARESTRPEISKAYRKLAGKWHPDRFMNKEDKEDAEKKFLQIASA